MFHVEHGEAAALFSKAAASLGKRIERNRIGNVYHKGGILTGDSPSGIMKKVCKDYGVVVEVKAVES